MNLLEEIVRRVRPGSGGQGPVSVTKLTRPKGSERSAPISGFSAPGSEGSLDSVSWPVALATERDTDGMPVHGRVTSSLEQAHLGAKPNAFPPYEPDDPDVLWKLFRVRA